MKKKYIQPVMATYFVETAAMIAASTLEIGDQTTGDAGVTSGNNDAKGDEEFGW